MFPPKIAVSRGWFWMIPILLWVTFISLHASHDYIFIDEFRSVEHLGYPDQYNDVRQVINSVAIYSAQHAPGYFATLRLWSDVAGLSTFSLRYMSILFGILGIAWMYRLGRDLFTPAVGVVSAFLLSTAAFYIFYMHEIRMYSAFAMFTIAEFWLYYRVAINPNTPNKWHKLGLFLTTFAIINTHYHAIFPLVAIGLYHLLFVPKNRRWLITTAVVCASGLVFLPWLPVVLRGTETILTGSEVLNGLRFFAVLLFQLSNGTLVGMVLLLIIAIAIMGRPQGNYLYVVFIGCSAVLLMFIANEGLMFMTEYRSGRYYLTLYPMFLIIAAHVILSLRRYRGMFIGVLFVWMLAGLVYAQTRNFDYYNNRAENDDYVGLPPMYAITAPLYRNNLAVPQNHLLILTDHRTLWRAQGEANYHIALLKMPGTVLDDERLERILTNTDYAYFGLDETVPIVWLAFEPHEIPQKTIDLAYQLLEARYEDCGSLVDSRNIIIRQFIQKPFGCQLANSSDGDSISFVEEAITLQSMETLVQDEVVHVASLWTVPSSVPLHTYSVSLKIYSPNNEIIAQQDYGLQESPGYWHYTQFDSSDWSSGDYIVEATVYNWQTGERITGITPNGNLKSFPVTQFTVP